MSTNFNTEEGEGVFVKGLSMEEIKEYQEKGYTLEDIKNEQNNDSNSNDEDTD